MADNRRGDRHRPRSGNRHANKGRTWFPDNALYERAFAAVKGDLGFTMTGWLVECLKYVVGERKTPPPRPAWAEERAASLPEEPPEAGGAD